MTNSTVNTELQLFVTHMDADGPLLKIWAQIENKEEGTAFIEKILHRLAPKFNLGLGRPMPQSRLRWENVCCASFEGGYYRAKIYDLRSNGCYTARFIDYGHTEILKPCDIRILDGIPEAAELQRIPALATDFIVADVTPRNNNRVWEPAVVGHILNRIRYNEYPGKIVRVIGKHRFVRINFEDQDLAEILVKQNLATASSMDEMTRAYACYQQSLPPQTPNQTLNPMMQSQPPNRDNVAKIPIILPRTQHHPPDNWRMPTQQTLRQPLIQTSPRNDEAAEFRSRILEIGSKHEVKVSYVEDGPLMFSVQVNSTLKELENLMRSINQNPSPQPLVEPPIIGTVCLGRYSIDKTRRRAVVMQVREHDCKIHYVDFGDVEILPYTDIYQLPRQYINPRILSIRFTMSNVNELKVNNEMKAYFKRYVAGKTLLLHVKPSEGSPLIQYGELWDNDRNVKDVLRDIFGNAVIAWQASRKLQLESREIVQVVYVDSSIIYVQLDSDAALLESLIGLIDEYVTTAPPFKPNQLAKGLQCVALSSEDSQWYRAEITNVSGDKLTVFYVDYGNEETIPSTSVRSISDNKITKIRAQAIRCVINDYDKEITTAELKEALETEITTRQVAMTVVQVTSAGPIVDLYDSKLEPIVNIIHRLKRSSVVNGNNVVSRNDNYNDKSTSSTHSNINRSDDQPNKWNQSQRSEPPRIPETSNSMDRGKSKNWRNDDNETRRYENRDNSYQNREKEWSPNSGQQQQQNDRFSRNEGKNERSPRDPPRYERNDRYDRSSDSNVNTRVGRDTDNRERGGRGGFGNNGRYTGNNSRNERNGSAEKAWSDKDSDTSSRGSGRRGSGGGGRGGSGGRGGRRESGRTPNTRDTDGDSDRGSFKNGRTNGVSTRLRRDFGENNETKQFDNWANKTPPIKKKPRIPLPNITVGAVKNCELVFMNNPGDFYVQLSPDNLELDPVMASIAEIYENGGNIIERSSIKQGIDCVAQYSDDSRWYRANVQSVEANGATVRFVDFGNVETVEFNKIKELEEDCAKLSAQAIGCKLLAAKKITWETEDIEKLSGLMDEKLLEAEFVANDDNVYEILIREVIDEKTFSNYINEEFSDGADLTDAKLTARLKGRGGPVEPVVPTNYAPIDEKWSVEIMNPGTKSNITITWFVNPDNFYCQTLSRKDEFRAMMNDIQQVYAIRTPINEPLQVGTPVMAVFSDDGAIYRAEILGLNKARGNIVRYIDFGNTAMVEQRNTYRVERKFMKIPKQAVNCSLKNIIPANGTSWARSNKQEIEKFFDQENFECTFHENKDGKYIVSLNNGDIDVAGLLVEKSLASFAVSAHVDVEKNEVEVTEQPSIEELPRFDISLLPGQVLRVKVSNVGSATKFHIQLPSADASDKVIDAYMAKNDPKVMPRLSYPEVCLGAGCLVNTDEGWKRAVVVNCSRTTGFDVRLIDTGANDEIPLDCMLALPGALSVMQNQAVECCLKNAKTSIVLDEKLRDRIENTNVIVAVDEVDNNRLIVKLYDTNGNIIKLSDDEKNETICPVCPMPILYSSQKVAVSHAEHSSSIWLKRTHDLDTDTDLLARMFDHYSVPRENSKKLIALPGALCAAKSQDENWYRGIILRSTDSGAVVQYIDYGNSEDVSFESLRALESEFFAQPQLAIEVALTVTLAGSMEQQQEILKSHIIDEEFTATMYNVHKKWVAELTNTEGKMSEKFSALEVVETTKNRHVQNNIPEMTVGERYKVTCHHADSPAAFWLQRNEEIAAIEQLQERLQIDATSLPMLEGIPDENTLCLAMYSIDDMWYRAEIIIADAEITTVRFIDFGNTDIVYTNQGKSKQISDSLKSIKRYATKCRLDVIPYGGDDWMIPAIEWFEGVLTSVENMEALVIADSTPRRVELFVDDKSLVDELVKRNYAARISNEEDLIEEIIEREVDPRAAYVSHAISPSEFWIQQEKYVGDLEILADRFIVADMFPKPMEIHEGLLCVAKFPEDESWYRARVVSHADTGTEVIYIDYGNSAISTEIREIPEDVAEQPAFSKKCRLALPNNIEQWSEEACVEFVKMAAEGATIFQLDVIEERDDTSIVRLTQNGKDIVENLTKLCEKSEIIPIIEERLPPLGEETSPNVLVSHVNSPADFSIQAESSINELEIMSEHLAAAENFLTLENIDEGTICAAKFPEDEQWYRAKILSHGDAGTEVHYIDYGNSAITTELRVLPDDIVKKPALSTCCSLLLPDNVDTWSRDACEKFFDLVNEGITMFQYEILEVKEQTIVRLSIDGNDIVEILAELCEKKRIEDVTSHEKMAINDVIVDNQDCTEIGAASREIYSEERISSNDTSGIEVVTNSDNSTLSSCGKLENSMDNSSVQIVEDKSQDNIPFDCSTSTVKVASDVEETTNVVVNVENVEKVVDVAENREKVVEEVTNVEKSIEEVPNDGKIVEEVSNEEKIVEEVSNVEKVVEEVPNEEKIVQEVPNVEKVVEEVPNEEKIVQEVSNVEKIVEEVSNVEKIVEEIPNVEKLVEQVPNVEKVVEEVPKAEKVEEEVPKDEKIAEEVPNVEKNVEEVPNVEKVVEEVSNADKVEKEVPKEEKIAEEVSNVEKTGVQVPNVEKIVEQVPNVEKIVEQVPNVEKVVEQVPNVEKVVEQVPNVEKVVEQVPTVEKIVEQVPNVEKVVEQVPNIEKVVKQVPNVEKVVEQVPNVEKVVEQVPNLEKVVEQVPNIEKVVKQVPNVEKVVEQVPNVEKVVEQVPTVEKIVEQVPNVEKVVEQVPNVEKVVEKVPIVEKDIKESAAASTVEKIVEEAAKIEKMIEKASSIVKVAEKNENIPTNEKANEKVPEKSEFILETIEPRKTPRTEKILPGSISRDLSEDDKIIHQTEEKILPQSINTDLKVDDETCEETSGEILPRIPIETNKNSNEDSSLVISRKLSFGEKTSAETISDCDSSKNEVKCPTTPKTPHSEKIVAGVVTLQENIDDLEKDEILSVVTDVNIPK